MNEQQLLAAIAENPDAAGPKLVYADWLEERGDPLADAWRWIVEKKKKPHLYASGGNFHWFPNTKVWDHHKKEAIVDFWMIGGKNNNKHKFDKFGIYFSEIDAYTDLARAYVEWKEAQRRQLLQEEEECIDVAVNYYHEDF